jgi:hypothetical protein
MVKFLAAMAPPDVKLAIDGFDESYKKDWDSWLRTFVGTMDAASVAEFRRILVKWQAVRSRVPNRRVRQLRAQATHSAPFLEDLFQEALKSVSRLDGLTVREMREVSRVHRNELTKLWAIFEQLPTIGATRCVGITKAVKLITRGAIGPALDTEVRKKLKVPEPADGQSWVDLLTQVSADLNEFEKANGVRIESLCSGPWARVLPGRAFDMVAGPRRSAA